MKNISSTPFKSETEPEQVANMRNEDLDFSDIPEITAEQFARAQPTAEFLRERGLAFDPSEAIDITETHADGTATVYPLVRSEPIYLDPRVKKYFPTSEAVNQALLGLIALIPEEAAANT